MTTCHECKGQMPHDHAAYCDTGRIATLQDEVARLRLGIRWYLRVVREGRAGEADLYELGALVAHEKGEEGR